MHIVAIHNISDPERFWGAVQQAEIPADIQLHSTLPNDGGSKAVCLWEADSQDAVRDLVEGVVGGFSNNEYFEIAAENAIGLPG